MPPRALRLIWIVSISLALTALGQYHRARVFAQPVPVRAAGTTDFWSGYVLTSDAPYSGVQATWSVPRVRCHAGVPDGTAYVWIGEGGYLRGPLSALLQAGTASDCFGGMPRYHAFFEQYPGGYAADFPLLLGAGDVITVQVRRVQRGLWELSVDDLTTGGRSVTTATAGPDTGSAELVVERPTVCGSWSCGQLSLARFGSVTFSNTRTWQRDGTERVMARQGVPLALTGTLGQAELAVPARGPRSGSPAVLWRAAE